MQTAELDPSTKVLLVDGPCRAKEVVQTIKGMAADFDGQVAWHVPGFFVFPKKFRKHAKRRAKAKRKHSRSFGLWY